MRDTIRWDTILEASHVTEELVALLDCITVAHEYQIDTVLRLAIVDDAHQLILHLCSVYALIHVHSVGTVFEHRVVQFNHGSAVYVDHHLL
jgi:hypothetical protein